MIGGYFQSYYTANNNAPQPAPAKNNVAVVGSSGFNTTAAVIGLGLVSAAGFLAVIFGMLAARKVNKDGVTDKLELLLDHGEDFQSTLSPLTNEAFVSGEAMA